MDLQKEFEILYKKDQRVRPLRKSFETDMDSYQILQSRGNRRKRLPGMSLGEGAIYESDRIKREQKRLYGIRKKEQVEDIDEIKRDVWKLQEELALMREGSSKKTYKLRHKKGARSRVNTEYIYSQQHSSLDNRKAIRKYTQGQSYPEYYRIASSPQKKLYKLKPKMIKYPPDHPTDYEVVHTPQPRAFKIRRFNTQSRYHSDANISSRIIHRHNISRLLRAPQNLRKFKKIVNLVLFTIRLRTFNQRMRRKRMKRFQVFVEDELADKLLKLKNTFVQYSKPFFTTIIDQFNFSYRLQDKDEPELKKQKVNAVLKLVGMEIKCLEKCIRNIHDNGMFIETIYLLCKHGNYSCKQEINTNEELNISCISETYGYIRSEKQLEQSSILSLVFIKILLYNILLEPDRIDMQVTTKVNPQIIYSNVRLIGNILYEIFIDIQDEYLEKAPLLYKVGNWLQLKKKFNFKIAESMTLKEGFFQKNELISGLASHNYIQHIYKTQKLTDERHALKELVRMLHESIARYHLQFRKQVFIM